MAQRVTRATQRNLIEAPSEPKKTVSFSIPQESNKKSPAKRGPTKKTHPEAHPLSTAPVTPVTSTQQMRLAPSPASDTTSDTIVPNSVSPSHPSTTSTTHAYPVDNLSHRLNASQTEFNLADARRTALQNLQATRYPHLAGISEPNLNDPSEVRHFEVDSQGSLTFLLLDGGEAWRLREIDVDSTEKGQMIVGRFYVVERV